MAHPSRSKVLLEWLRTYPGPVDLGDSGAADELVRDATRHGLAGLLRHQVAEAGLSLPPEAARSLGVQAMAWEVAAVKVKTLLFRALKALEARGVRPVLLKGYGLAARVYPRPLLRATSDVDLLVAPSELEEARLAMLSLGLSPEPDADEYYPPQYRHHLAFGSRAGLVEVHFRPMANWGLPWDGDLLLARARRGTLDGREVRFLCPEDELVYLALHAAAHMLTRVGWLYDLKLLVNAHPALEWKRVVSVARDEARLPAATFYAFDAARRAVGAAFPEDVMAALAPPRVAVAAARRVFSDQHLVDGYLTGHKKVWAAAKLVLADSPARVGLFALRRLVWNARHSAVKRFPRLGLVVP